MIADRLENLSLYIPIIPQLKDVIAILESDTLASLPLGYHSTDDPTLRYNILHYETVLTDAQRYEIHLRDADVQILLSGCERVDAADRNSFVTTVAYDEKKDVLFGDGQKIASYHAAPDRFVIFFAGEPHAPNLISHENSEVHKVVFKVIV